MVPRRGLAALATAVALGLVATAPHTASATSAASPTPLGDPINRPWLGYGLNVEPEPGGGSSPSTYTDAMASLDATRLSNVKPQIVRDTWLTTGFDPTNLVGQYDWTTTWATNEFKQLDALKTQDVPVMVGWWSTPWDASSVDHATVVADFLNYLINTKGYTNIVAWDGMNEPNHRDPTTYARWKTEVENIRTALAAKHLAVGIVGPGTQDASASTSWLSSASQQMTSDLSGYDIHYYPTGATDISSGAVAPWMLSLENTINGNDPGNKPMYVEEVGWKYGWDSTNDAQPHVIDYTYGLNMAAMGIQLARGGASAPMAWRLADLGSPKVWGMYNGAGGDISLRPWSYSWTMLTQAFPKNATLYKPTQPTSVFTMLGSIGSGSSQHWSIAVANLTSNTSTQTFTLPNSAGRILHAYRYVDGTRATNSDGFPASTDTVTAASNGDVTVSVAADSMLLLSDIDG